MKFVYHLLMRGVPYLGIGFLCAAIFMGPTLDWANAWTYAYVLGWPVTLVVTFLMAFFFYALLLVAAVVVVGVIYHQVETRFLRPRRRAKAVAARTRPGFAGRHVP